MTLAIKYLKKEERANLSPIFETGKNKTMHKIIATLLFHLLLIAGSAQSNYTNIKIDEGTGFSAPEEPSILINPKTPSNLIAAANINNGYFSTDTGRTWTKQVMKSELGVYGDPCLIADKKGRIYYFHLSNPDGKGWASDKLLDRIVCQYSKNGGKTWSKGVGIGLNGSKDQDKEWGVVNHLNNHIYVTWTQFDKYNSTQEQDSTVILFSKSKRRGKKWDTPIRINQYAGDCLDEDETVEGAVPTVGPNGEIYVSWSFKNELYFDRSFDEGKTWMDKDIVAANNTGGWAFDIPGIQRANGMPITKADISKSEYRGNIYINWSDQRNGHTDVWLIKSTDKGSTWSDPKKVNDDLGKADQFFTWMDVDPVTGIIYIVFYDRRNYDDNRTDVYLASSSDGGETFVNEKISESPFVPSDKVFFGDYNNISAYNGIIRPIWTRYEDGKLSIWTALINR
jgi:hypothetical protein